MGKPDLSKPAAADGIAFNRKLRFVIVLRPRFPLQQAGNPNEGDIFLISQPYGELLCLFRPNLSSK
jgi:hypothetical protein